MPGSYSWPLDSGAGSISTPDGGVASDSAGAYLPRDLLLGDDGDVAVVGGDLQIARGVAAIRQSLQMRISLWRGEWFADESRGVPYLEQVLVKNPNLTAIRSLFRDAIDNTPGVQGVDQLTMTFDRSTRTVSISFHCTTDLGELADTVEVQAP